jgi:hypothetical protein
VHRGNITLAAKYLSEVGSSDVASFART